jgi:hypothetical protein
MYSSIQTFYKFLVESIEPEDFDLMKQTLHYTESYDEHIDSLLKGIPQKQTTIDHIVDFLTQYKEFASQQYVQILDTLNERMMAQPEHCKQAAFKILSAKSATPDDVPKQQPGIGETSSKVEAIVGGNYVSFNTYKDPLLVSLYSLLLTWFSIKTYGIPPTPIDSGNSDSQSHIDIDDAGGDEDDILSVD